MGAEAPYIEDDNGVIWIDLPSLHEWVLLCVDSRHPIDPGNYPGPIHCTAHPEGHACVTANYARLPGTTRTEDERNPEGRDGR